MTIDNDSVGAAFLNTSIRVPYSLRIRQLSVVLAAALIPSFILQAAPASASDFALAYALDLNGRQITGTLENCTYNQVCQRQIDQTDLIIGLVVKGALDTNAGLYLSGKGGCCFFAGGSRSIRADLRTSTFSAPIFEGKERSGNEFVQNRPAGTIHLAVSYK